RDLTLMRRRGPRNPSGAGHDADSMTGSAPRVSAGNAVAACPRTAVGAVSAEDGSTSILSPSKETRRGDCYRGQPFQRPTAKNLGRLFHGDSPSGRRHEEEKRERKHQGETGVNRPLGTPWNSSLSWGSKSRRRGSWWRSPIGFLGCFGRQGSETLGFPGF